MSHCGSATRTGVGPQASRLRASHDASQYNVIVTRGSIHFAPRSPHRGKKPRVAPHAYANQTPLRCSQINLPHLTRAQRAKRKKCVNVRFPSIQIFRPCSPSLSDFPCSFGKSICTQTGSRTNNDAPWIRVFAVVGIIMITGYVGTGSQAGHHEDRYPGPDPVQGM